MKLEELSLVELKGLAYDQLVAKETAENNLKAVNNVIRSKLNERDSMQEEQTQPVEAPVEAPVAEETAPEVAPEVAA